MSHRCLPRARGRLLVAVIGCGVVLAASRVSAQAPAPTTANDDVARGLFQAATAAYNAGDYHGALQLYEQAYERSRRPGFLYNIGQVADRLRDDEKALASFRAYLEQVPDAPNRAEVEHRIVALEEARNARAAATTPLSTSAPSSSHSAPTPGQVATQAGAALTPPARLAADHHGDEMKPTAGRDTAITQKWWFWGVGAVVLAGAATALAIALSGGSSGQAPPYLGNGGSLHGP